MKTIIGLLLGLSVFGCSAPSQEPTEDVGYETSDLCSARTKLVLNEVYEQAGGNCGLWPSSLNPYQFDLHSQTAFASPNGVCYWAQPGACNQFFQNVWTFNNTAQCFWNNGTYGEYDLSISMFGAKNTVTKRSGCVSTYNVVAKQILY